MVSASVSTSLKILREAKQDHGQAIISAALAKDNLSSTLSVQLCLFFGLGVTMSKNDVKFATTIGHRLDNGCECWPVTSLRSLRSFLSPDMFRAHDETHHVPQELFGLLFTECRGQTASDESVDTTGLDAYWHSVHCASLLTECVSILEFGEARVGGSSHACEGLVADPLSSSIFEQLEYAKLDVLESPASSYEAAARSLSSLSHMATDWPDHSNVSEAFTKVVCILLLRSCSVADLVLFIGFFGVSDISSWHYV